MKVRGLLILAAFGSFILAAGVSHAQRKIVWSENEKPIVQQIRTLRSLPDDVRAVTTKKLALEIRGLPPGQNKALLADDLAQLSTEGDFGRDTLQEVTSTLASALREHPFPPEHGQPAEPYAELAELVRYEHMQAASDSPEFAQAMAKLEADDRVRESANFTLKDLDGKTWSLRDLRGKVVAVNFWATWCPPCRKEMPDLQALYDEYKDQGLVVLAISYDEDASKIRSFIAKQGFGYPVLLDPGGSVERLYRIDGWPKTFVYDREGKLVAESIDMRTRNQFLQMLAQAGLK